MSLYRGPTLQDAINTYKRKTSPPPPPPPPKPSPARVPVGSGVVGYSGYRASGGTGVWSPATQSVVGGSGATSSGSPGTTRAKPPTPPGRGVSRFLAALGMGGGKSPLERMMPTPRRTALDFSRQIARIYYPEPDPSIVQQRAWPLERKSPSFAQRLGSAVTNASPAAGGMSMGSYLWDLARGDASVSDLPRAAIKAGAYSVPGVRQLAQAGDAYFDQGDPGEILPLARALAHTGAVTGGLRALGVPVPEKLEKWVALADVTTVLGSAVLAARSTHDYVHHRGSFGEMASQTGGFALGAAGLALPFMRGAGVLSKLSSSRLAKRGIDSTELPEDAVEVISTGKDLLEYGSRLRPGGEDGDGSRTGGYARGGRVRRGETALVGERGPEIVQLPAGANVIPAHRSRELLELAGAGAAPVGAPGAPTQLHVHQYLDGREIALSTVRDLDDDEQWERGGGRWTPSTV